MRIFLDKVSVSDYNLFRKLVMEETHWTRLQYNDRKNGRVKLSFLETEAVQRAYNKLQESKQAFK